MHNAFTLTASKMRFIAQMSGMLLICLWLFLHPDVSVALALVALTAQYTTVSKAGEVLNNRSNSAVVPPLTP